MATPLLRLRDAGHARIFMASCSRRSSQLAHAPDSVKTQPAGYPYSISRNSRGSLPVYSDVRSGGNRYLVLVKNVQGDINALCDDIISTLHKPDTQDTSRMTVKIAAHNTLVITGGRWKHHVMEWLKRRGF